ncbi:MAG: putative surface protein with fasciclin (FAS1) repeats [Sphingobacteriales bacterium]|jgi:uncharacterized surface protein with fasciclin (FAS1) repeats
MKKFLLAVMAAGSMAMMACGDSTEKTAEKAEKMTEEMAPKMEAEKASLNIVETAMGNENFTTLVAAIKAAGLVDALSSEGPFTVFAPTNAAFAKLPKGTVENLLKPENKEKLAAILTYHVVPMKVMAADVKTMMAPTVNGKEMSVSVSDKGVMVDKSMVVSTDIVCSNGVIHVIDAVIMP